MKPTAISESVEAQVLKLKSTAYSFEDFRLWLNENMTLFGLAGTAASPGEASEVYYDWNDLLWDGITKAGYLPVQITIDVPKSSLAPTDVRHYFMRNDEDGPNLEVTHDWMLDLNQFPFVTVTFFVARLASLRQEGKKQVKANSILSHYIPLHFPEFTLDKLLLLDSSGLLPIDETLGTPTVNSIGAFLNESNRQLLATGVGILPCNLVPGQA